MPSAASKAAADPNERTIGTNRRARHEYTIEETFEAGIVLTGPEVKSLRAGRVTLADAYARVQGEEVWIEQMHIPPYEMSDTRSYNPVRPRKLLLHRAEIRRLIGKTAERGLTLVPLKIYFTRGIAKVELGLGRGRQRFEKRHAIAEREHQREIERAYGSRDGRSGDRRGRRST